MSGICGLFNIDTAPVSNGELQKMASPLERRGPDGTAIWQDGVIGMGHSLLATTPEAFSEQLPLVDVESGCVITADARLDNRTELLDAVDTHHRFSDMGDGALILWVYLTYGTAGVERLQGDFAFAIWDPRRQRLFCARDRMGVRPLYYHVSKGRFMVFASEPQSILSLPKTPRRINEGRIADYLVTQLEGIDKTSTFFEEIYRLPPAHTLSVTPRRIQKQQYWTLEPGPELRLDSDAAYVEAFLDVFTKAVNCRLRGDGTVGAMLSGGMDSGSVVAVARNLLMREGRGRLSTFSAISPSLEQCPETRAVFTALTMSGLDSRTIHYNQLGALTPDLETLTWNIDEPFDNHMTLVRAIYLIAHRQGIKSVLDGIDADTVLSGGSHLTRLARQGRWVEACREAAAQSRFWGANSSAWREAVWILRSAFLPHPVRRLYRSLHSQPSKKRLKENIRTSIISSRFARRINLMDRLQTLDSHRSSGLLASYAEERAQAIDHPYLTVGVERYNRVAASVAVEPRHPFLDDRVIALCLRLPGEQKLKNGYPKAILRRAAAGMLPDAVRWRKGKEHLGWDFTKALMKTMGVNLKRMLRENVHLLENYIDIDKVSLAHQMYFDAGDLSKAEMVYEAAHLAEWLRRNI